MAESHHDTMDQRVTARPRFYSGQLLTAEDLQSLVDYTQSRIERLRESAGAGVITGLVLRGDGEDPGALVIEPGVAVTASGQEIYLAEAMPLTAQKIRDLIDPSACNQENLAGIYDLVLEPKPVEQKSQFNKDEIDRTIESFCPTITPHQAVGKNPASDAWEQDLAAWMAPVANLVQAAQEQAPGFLDNFRALVAEAPLLWYSDLQRELDQLEDDSALTAGTRNRLLCLLALDRWQQFPLRADAEPASGVRLGRFWLSETAGQLRIDAIDSAAPLRQALAPQGAPAPSGRFNMTPMIGTHWLEARALLERQGLHVLALNELQLDQDSTLGSLEEALDRSPFLEVGAEYILDYVDLDGLGKRLVDLRPVARRLDAGLTLKLNSDRRHAEPGETVTIHMVLRNEGLESISFDLYSEALDFEFLQRELPPYCQLEFRLPLKIASEIEEGQQMGWERLPDGTLRLTIQVEARILEGDERVVESIDILVTPIGTSMGHRLSLDVKKTVVRKSAWLHWVSEVRWAVANAGDIDLRVAVSDPLLDEVKASDQLARSMAGFNLPLQERQEFVLNTGPDLGRASKQPSDATVRGWTADGRELAVTAKTTFEDRGSPLLWAAVALILAAAVAWYFWPWISTVLWGG